VHYDVTNARKLAEARHELDWDEQFRLSLYREHARKIHERDGEIDLFDVRGFVCGQRW
jgi:phosphomethylpyrimidine synthase